jgi:hypothetical protein
LSEQELRDGLQVAVADEPPMTFDLDELVSTAERLVRRRRALIAVGAGTAAVALAAVTIPVVLGIARSEPQELPLATSPGVSASAPPVTVPLPERAEQLRGYLRTKFPQVIPEATEIDVRPFGGEAEGAFFDGQTYVTGTVRYTVSGARTAMFVEIHSPNDQSKASRDCPGCDLRAQPDGSSVMIETAQADDMIIARHFRNDGTVVTVSTFGHDPTGLGSTGATPKLSVDQLVSLAADPSLRL